MVERDFLTQTSEIEFRDDLRAEAAEIINEGGLPTPEETIKVIKKDKPMVTFLNYTDIGNITMYSP